MKLEPGQKVKVYTGWRRNRIGSCEGTVTKVGRTLATITWGSAWHETGQFYMDGGSEKGEFSDRYFKTLEEAERDERRSVAVNLLGEHGIDLTYRFKGSLEMLEALAEVVRTATVAETVQA